MHNYQLYLPMSEQHVRLNPVITPQHVSPLTCQVFQCSIKGVINGELFFIAHKEHRPQVGADTCKYRSYKMLKHEPLICKNPNCQQNEMNKITGTSSTLPSKCIYVLTGLSNDLHSRRKVFSKTS